MTPIEIFNAVWQRCGHIEAIHRYLAANLTGALQPDELLRSEWAMRVSALDLFVHELVAQRMSEVFAGLRARTDAYQRFQVSMSFLSRLDASGSPAEKFSTFDLEVRTRHAALTFQNPEQIADAVRLVSPVELWNEVATKFGAALPDRNDEAKQIKTKLSLIVRRRNVIVHEGDLQQTTPRIPNNISRADVDGVRDFVEKLVKALDELVA